MVSFVREYSSEVKGALRGNETQGTNLRQNFIKGIQFTGF